MKYAIRHLIKGEAELVQQKYMQEIKEKFDVKKALSKKQQAHITLKYSFQANKEEIQELEHIIKQFCTTKKAVPFKMTSSRDLKVGVSS